MSRHTMVLMTAAIAALAAPGAPLASETKAPAAESDAKRFQGTWRLLSLVRDGKDVPKGQTETMELVFLDNKYTYKGPHGERDEGTFTVDAQQQPAVMTTTHAKAGEGGTSVVRIYRWIDADTVRFCSPGPKDKKPPDFTAPAGSGRELSVWKRSKS